MRSAFKQDRRAGKAWSDYECDRYNGNLTPLRQRQKLIRAVVSLLLISWLLKAPGVSATDDVALWKALKSGGHIALLRHALAPGTGDPPSFLLDKCSTQRNLSDRGREQAVQIGARFRAAGIEEARVYSSQWCRCIDTAELLKLGKVQALPALNSFFQKFERRDLQTRILKKWLASQDLSRPLVLVTHQVNITAFADVYLMSGEMVIIKQKGNGDFSVLGSIEFD